MEQPYDLLKADELMQQVIAKVYELEGALLDQVERSRPDGGIFAVELLSKLDNARSLLRVIERQMKATITK